MYKLKVQLTLFKWYNHLDARKHWRGREVSSKSSGDGRTTWLLTLSHCQDVKRDLQTFDMKDYTVSNFFCRNKNSNILNAISHGQTFWPYMSSWGSIHKWRHTSKGEGGGGHVSTLLTPSRVFPIYQSDSTICHKRNFLKHWFKEFIKYNYLRFR